MNMLVIPLAQEYMVPSMVKDVMELIIVVNERTGDATVRKAPGQIGEKTLTLSKRGLVLFIEQAMRQKAH